MKRNVPGAAAARDRLITWNRKAERPRMQPGAREMLMKHDNDDLEQFNQLLGVDMIDQELAVAMPKRPPIGELNNRQSHRSSSPTRMIDDFGRVAGGVGLLTWQH